MIRTNARKTNMKNKSYIGISFILLVFGIIFIPRIIDRIQGGTIKDTNRLNGGVNETSEQVIQTIGAVPQFDLTNQNNETITHQTMLGKVYVVEFFFSTCPTICPKMNENMKVIASNFESKDNFGIISITINPDYDTPDVLKAHAEELGVTHPHWHFLSGNRDYIFNISNKGFNLYAAQNPNVDGGFEHSGLFALVDKKGNIRSRKDNFGNPIVYYDGLEEESIASIMQDINVLLKE